jgi:intraflagellar transport protein 88
LGQYHDAVESFENIMQGEPDFQAAYNLILCYFALGDKEKMKKGFTQLLTIEIPGLEEEEDEEPDADFANDAISVYLKDMRNKAYKYITDAAKLIAPVIESDWTRGYDWVIETLRASDFSVVESELGIHKAVQYMKQRNFDQAIEVFKSFEKKDKAMMARVATNISFLYFIEKDLKNAEKYADIAIKNDRYNAKALVNKGNCLFIREEYEAAKNYFLEAIGVEADCVEAIYNLGLVNRRLEETRADAGYETLQAFEKLQSIMNNAPEVLFQIGSIYERAEDYQQAIKWYNLLVTRLPSDAGVLQRIARMHSLLQEENQAFHYYSESYRHFPVSIETIQWLGAFYVKSELYEKAWTFFERAAQIQPLEVKWKLMVASCFRRMGSYQRALKVFEEIHEAHPENVDCLQYLVSLCKEMNLKYDHYNIQLKKLLREKEMETPFIEPPQPQYQPQSTQPTESRDVQVRPGTSRTAGRRLTEKREEGDWANEDIELP